MTLFSLNNDRKVIRRNFFIYLGVVIFCIIFGLVYEYYSHNVLSYFMLLGFLFPLGLGLLPYGLLFFLKSDKGPGALTSNVYNGAVAVLTVGSYFKGVLDIYGTTREVFVIIYFSLGSIMAAIGLILYVLSLTNSGGEIK